MKKIIVILRFIVVITSLCFISACGTAAGHKFTTLMSSTQLPSELGRIFVYRSGALGSDVRPVISIDSVCIGYAYGNGFMYVDKKPGTYEVSAIGANNATKTPALTITIKNGQAIYVRVSQIPRSWKLELVEPAVAQKNISNLNYIFSESEAKVNLPLSLVRMAQEEKNTRVGIINVNKPVPDLSFGSDVSLLFLFSPITSVVVDAVRQYQMSESTVTLRDSIKSLDTSEYFAMVGNLEARLKRHIVNTRTLDSTLDLKSLPEFDIKALGNLEGKYEKQDFRSLAKTYNIDKLLLINIARLGIGGYYSSGEEGIRDIEATCFITGELIDLKNNRIIRTIGLMPIIPLGNNWNQPPDYTNVKIAVKEALKRATDAMEREFFEAE